jgi:phosphoglycerate dehydrogenase-like enzyme
MIITPHCTPEMPDMPANCVDIIRDNIRLFREGLPLRNQVDARDVYTKT